MWRWPMSLAVAGSLLLREVSTLHSRNERSRSWLNSWQRLWNSGEATLPCSSSPLIKRQESSLLQKEQPGRNRSRPGCKTSNVADIISQPFSHLSNIYLTNAFKIGKLRCDERGLFAGGVPQQKKTWWLRTANARSFSPAATASGYQLRGRRKESFSFLYIVLDLPAFFEFACWESDILQASNAFPALFHAPAACTT